MKLSPENWYYKFDPNGPSGQRLTRKRHMEQSWAVTTDSVQLMSAEELRFVAGVIDEARVGVVK